MWKRRAAINARPALEVIQLWLDMIRVHQVTRPPGTQFETGKDTFMLSGNWHVAQLVNNAKDLDWGVSLFPTRLPSQAPSSFVGGDLIGISAQSKHPNEAWTFIQFALSKEIQADVFAANGIIPVRRDFGNNECFQREPRHDTFRGPIGWTGTVYRCLQRPIRPFGEKPRPMFKGQVPPQQALEALERDMNVVLRDANK